MEENHGEAFIEITSSEKYKVFQVDTTDEHGILKTWSKIWEQEEIRLLKRAYLYDLKNTAQMEKLKFI